MEQNNYFTEEAVAVMLATTAHKLITWRVLNAMLQAERYGPPCVYLGDAIGYPKDQFRHWCASVRKINGVPCMDLPL